MVRCLKWVCLAIASVVAQSSFADERAKVEFVASGELAGDAIDLSGDKGTLSDGSPHNRLGGFSAIEYTGEGNRFLVLADRGPADGATEYACRWHIIDLKVDLPSKRIKPALVSTQKLINADSKPLLGSLALLDRPETAALAFDPEGIRKLPNGDWILTDEYGPTISLFSNQGKLKSRWSLPDWMHLSSGSTAEEWKRGTVPNRGLEGVAVTDDGSLGLAAMQSCLGQDADVSGKKRIGKFARLVAFDPKTPGATTKQYAYPLEDSGTGISEVLAWDISRFLVLERDGEGGDKAKIKSIYLIDLSKASDISKLESISSKELPAGMQPVAKTLLIDLLDPRYGYDGPRAQEKPEGMAWGPRLEDGRRTLWVCYDNDFDPKRPNLFLLFAL